MQRREEGSESLFILGGVGSVPPGRDEFLLHLQATELLEHEALEVASLSIPH